MPRPIFGQADWWTFEELNDPGRFHHDPNDHAAPFFTDVAKIADAFAFEHMPNEPERRWEDDGPEWPTLEFCVSRGTKTFLMVRRRE